MVSVVQTALPSHNLLSLMNSEQCIVNSESGDYPNNNLMMRRAGLSRVDIFGNLQCFNFVEGRTFCLTIDRLPFL